VYDADSDHACSPHQAATVTFGGLKGEISYNDQAFGARRPGADDPAFGR